MVSISRPIYPAILHLSVIMLTLVVGVDVATADDSISFNRQIRPILSDHCFHCHGPDAENQDSDFRLDTRENMVADLGGYFGVVPGDPDSSELIARIHEEDSDLRMPPPKEVRQLDEQEKSLLKKWIEQGAKFEEHWSFVPIPNSVVPPEITKQRKAWVQNEIDLFVLQRLASAGLEPTPAAPREKWLRRVTFDLTGLPPSPREVREFVADSTTTAFENVVDRLLSSTACAERLTSEWLDVARYSDSYGYQRDDYRHVWPYRDWVVDAFRQNMPYDQFVTEQLAGDLLPDANSKQILATAFNRLHSHKKEGGSDPEEFRIEYVADRTNTFGAAFLGLTFECAKCHDHKYDPLKTKEYYELSSFFSGIDEYGIISFFTNAVPTPAMPLLNKKQKTELAKAKQKITALEAAYQRRCEEQEPQFQKWLVANRAPVKSSADLKGRITHLSFDKPAEPAEGQQKNLQIKNSVPDSPIASSSPKNQYCDGKRGSGLHLTGDHPVTIPKIGHFSREQPFSFSIWIQPIDVEHRAVIYRRSRGWDDAGHIGYELTQTGAKLSAKICHFWPGNAIGILSEEILKPEQWTHIAVTYDGSSRAAGLKMFIDGQPANAEIESDTLTRQIKNWSGGENELAIGTRYRDRGFKNGKIDEFLVFDRQLSAVEVRRLFEIDESTPTTSFQTLLQKTG